MKKALFSIALAATISFALACGGGGGSSSLTPTPSGSISPTISPTTSPTTTPTTSPTATPTATPGQASYISGKIVEFPSGNNLSGVQLKSDDGTVYGTTLANGSFNIAVPPGLTEFTFVKTDYLPRRYSKTLLRGETNYVGTLYFVTSQSGTTIMPAAGTTLVVSDKVEIDLPASSLPTGAVISASYIAEKTMDIALPGQLPAQLGVVGGVVVVSSELLSGTATIRIANAIGLTPGFTVPIGYYNESTGLWEDFGTGTVSIDGSWIVFTTTHFSSFLAGLPVISSAASERELYDVSLSGSSFITGEPHVDSTNGNLMIGVDTPPIFAYGVDNALTLLYETDSLRDKRMVEVTAKGRPAENSDAMFGRIRVEVLNNVFEAMVTDESDSTITRTLVDATYENEEGERQLYPTGVYPYNIAYAQYFAGKFAASTNGSFTTPAAGSATNIDTGPIPFTATSQRYLTFVNNRESKFGKGWYLAGLERLVFGNGGFACAVVNRRAQQPLIFTRDKELFAENYYYMVSADPPGAHDPFSEWSHNVVTATDGEWVYIADTYKIDFMSSGETTIYKMKDPLARTYNDDEEYPDSPVAGEEITTVGTIMSMLPHGDQMVVDPSNHYVHMARIDSIVRLVDGSWENVISASDINSENVNSFKFAPNGDLYILTNSGVYRKVVDEAIEKIYDIANYLALGVDRLGYFYVADWNGRISRGSVDGDGITTVEEIAGDGTRNPLEEDDVPLAEADLDDVRDITFNTANEMFFNNMFRVYRVDTHGFVRPLNGNSTGMFVGPERVPAKDVGIMEAAYIAVGQGDTIYVSGIGMLASIRFWYRAQGTWNCKSFENNTLLIEGTDYIRTTASGDKFTYDADGYLTDIKLKGGSHMILTYEPDGDDKRLAKYEIEKVTHWDFTYSDSFVKITDETSRQTVITLTNGNASSILTPGGVLTNYTYNDDGLIVSRIDPANNLIEYEYDERNFITSVVYGNSYTQTISPDGVTGLINEFSNEGTWPNLAPQVTSSTASFSGDDEPAITFKRDGLTLEVEQNGKKQTKEYYEDGKIHTMTYPDGKTVEYFYSTVNGQLSKTINNIKGDIWTATFNSSGQMESMTNPIGERKSYTYDDDGKLSYIFSGSSSTSLTYNEFGMPIKQTRNGSDEIEAVYNSRGMITSITRYNVTTGYEYNIYGQVNKKTDGADSITYTYNTGGLITGISTPQGSYTFETQGLHNTSLIGGYVPQSVITHLSKTGGSATFTYDRFFHCTDISSSDGSYHAVYDPNGLPTHFTFPSGDGITFNYDDNGKLQSKSMPGRSVSFNYNTDGEMTTASSDAARVSFGYEDGNMKSMTYTPLIGGACPAIVLNLNVQNGRTLGTSFSGQGSPISYGYAGFNMAMDSATFSGQGVCSISRNGRGQIVAINAAIGNIAYSRNGRGFITSFTGSVSGATYVWDGFGCVSYSDSFGTHGVTRDYGGRVTAVSHPVTYPGLAESYAYDGNGNRTYSHLRGSATFGGDMMTGDENFAYSYDNAKRLSSEIPAYATDVLRTYTWDAEGNLTGVYVYNGMDGSSGVAHSYTYIYNAFGLRTGKFIDSVLYETYAYDHKERLVGIFNAAGSLIAQFSHADEPNRPLTAVINGTYCYFAQDGFRNVVQVSNGVLTETYTYDAYGNIVAEVRNGIRNPFRFAGAEYDEETGLYYMKHRWYHPQLGRFLSPDPSLYRAGFNMYAYAKGNPFRYYDPSGRDDEDDESEEYFFNPNYDIGNAGGTTDIGYGNLVDSTQSQIWCDDVKDLTNTAAGVAFDQGVEKGVEKAGEWAIQKWGPQLLVTATKYAPTVVGIAAKGGSRLVPFVGWALFAKDVLEVGAWGYGQYEYYRNKP